MNSKQKKYLKENVRLKDLDFLARETGIEESEIKNYFKKVWRKEKYEKYFHKKKGETNYKTTYVSIFLAIVALAVYINSLGNGFVSDDLPAIVNNVKIGEFSNIFFQPWSFIRPLFYWIIFHITGSNPWLFRLLNIALHLGSVLILYLLVKKIATARTALITALLFAVHPILTESITWISGGPYAQYSFFVILALWYYTETKFKRSVFSYLLAAMTAPLAVVFPLMLGLYELTFGNLKANWKRLVPYFVISGLWTLFLSGMLGYRVNTLKNDFYQDTGKFNPLIQIPLAITEYLRLIFWPSDLTLYHSELVISPMGYGVRLLVMGGLLALLVYGFKRQKLVFFGLSFFIISLLVTLTPLKISSVVAERYVYLGSLGVILVIALLINKLIEKSRYMGWTVLIILTCLLSVRTIIRNADWRSEDSLWLASAKTSPSSENNHNNLGDYYSRQGDYHKAVKEFSKAIELKPNYADAFHNRANAYLQLKNFTSAEADYLSAIRFNPRLWQSDQNLAGLYYQQGKIAKAIEYLQKALELVPDNQVLQENLRQLKLIPQN